MKNQSGKSITLLLIFISVIMYMAYTTPAEEVVDPTVIQTLQVEVPVIIEEPFVPPPPPRICIHSFNKTQTENLRTAHLTGRSIGYPETIQAILLVETVAGKTSLIGNKVAAVGKRAYGLMQIKTTAARFVYNNYPDVFAEHFPGRKMKSIEDEEIIVILLSDKEKNLELGALNFELMVKHTKSWDRAVTAYYTGLTGLKSQDPNGEHFYLKKIREQINKNIRPNINCLS